LYRLKTLSKIIILSLNLLVLGIDVSALQEALGIQESTLRTWLTRSGAQSRKLHEHFFRDLSLEHIQLDELWGSAEEYRSWLKSNGLSGNINASFVERVNSLAPPARAGVTIR